MRVFFVLSFTLLLPINAFAERHIATIGIQKVVPVALPSSPMSQGSYVFGLASTKAIAGETPKAATPTTPSLPVATAALVSTVPTTGQPYAQAAAATTPTTPATPATTPANQQAVADAQAAQAAAEEAANNAQQQNQQAQQANQQVNQQANRLRDERTANLERQLAALQREIRPEEKKPVTVKKEELTPAQALEELKQINGRKYASQEARAQAVQSLRAKLEGNTAALGALDSAEAAEKKGKAGEKKEGDAPTPDSGSAASEPIA